MFSQVFHHNCIIRKCDTEGEGLEYLTTCMAAGRQRVDTQGGDRGEDLKALSFDVHWKLEHLQSRMNTAYR